MKEKSKKIFKAFLKSFKITGWKLFIALKLYDVVYYIFVLPFLSEKKKEETMKKDLKANIDFHNRINKIADKESLKEAIKEQWKIRKDKN